MSIKRIALLLFLTIVSAACVPAPEKDVNYDPTRLQFDGERALETETEFVNQFPNRASGMPNNKLAAVWLFDQFTQAGFDCAVDEWDLINYSQPVTFRNVVCRLEGNSSKEILVVAHHDQSPDTIYGTDNDGSGIAILLKLAEIFGSETRPEYTLVFAATDGEEFGMLGSQQIMDTHPDTENIIAGISLDNLGKRFYDGLEMAPLGQFHGYGPLWLMRTAQDAAAAAGDLWVPEIRAPFDQVLNQAVPFSFMDQGPMVEVGVPAFGFAGLVAEGQMENHWNTFHTPDDTLEYQSADVLYQSGRVTEAVVRELLARDVFPEESGPYLYLQDNNQVVRGLPLWSGFTLFVGIFFLGVFFKTRNREHSLFSDLQNALPHFFGLWLPLLASIILTYGMVGVGLMDKYDTYPGTNKDEVLFEPIWSAVIVYLVGLAIFLYVGRVLARKYTTSALEFSQVSLSAFVVISLAGVAILIRNPFSLVFVVPVLFWFLIKGRRGVGKLVDIFFFILGGLMAFALLYFFGFVILRNDFAILWHILMMFSVGMFNFRATLIITSIIAAGLSLIVNPAVSEEETVRIQARTQIVGLP